MEPTSGVRRAWAHEAGPTRTPPPGAAHRAELLHVLMLPDFDRAGLIGEFWGYPESGVFAELLIECQEDWTLRAHPVGGAVR
jgi:hypothetical protein